MNYDNEHPPVAEGVICIDFDATLFPWGALDGEDPPFDGAAEAANAFKAAGYRIVILTSRMSPTWWRHEGWPPSKAEGYWYAVTAARLDKWGIPWDTITAEKVPAIAYIDDKAIEFTGDWPSIVERILGPE